MTEKETGTETKKRFNKIYVEISNICNYRCSFCSQLRHEKRAMTLPEFARVIEAIKPYTKYIYLHILGEPFIHHDLCDMIELATSQGIKVNITTNGQELGRAIDSMPHEVLKKARQYNISLHDASENVPEPALAAYLARATAFADMVEGHSLVTYRLWNSGAKGVDSFNLRCLEALQSHYGIDLQPETLLKRSTTLRKGIYLMNASRFAWPDNTTTGAGQRRCYGMKDHVGILSDGAIVPCCIDTAGSMRLGNIFTDDFGEVIASERAEAIREGFARGRAVEPFCRSCGFIMDK